MKVTDKITITKEDNMQLMARYPDNHFDLAVVDPPYGIGEDGKKNHSRGKLAKPKLYTPKKWDSKTPDEKYFSELKRVSKNVIIWGANHFIEKIPNSNSSSWIVWDKENGENDFADCELAYTDHKTAVRKFVFRWAGMLQGDMSNKETRIHPTQKPVALYKWIFEKYGNPNFKCLDTHIGSGSIAIAFDEMLTAWSLAGHDISNAELTACELDKDYFDATIKRLNNKFGNNYTFDDAPENQTNIFNDIQ